MPKFDAISRFRLTDVLVDDVSEEQTLFYASREPLQFIEHDDNSVYVTEPGDTLWRIAAKHFVGFPEPSNLWWAIAEFQPEPIADPTLAFPPGTEIVLPPPNLVGDLLGRKQEPTV